MADHVHILGDHRHLPVPQRVPLGSREGRDALAKASQLIEDGHESITFRDLAGNVIDQAAMNAFAKKEKRGLGRWRCFPKWKLSLAKRR